MDDVFSWEEADVYNVRWILSDLFKDLLFLKKLYVPKKESNQVIHFWIS